MVPKGEVYWPKFMEMVARKNTPKDTEPGGETSEDHPSEPVSRDGYIGAYVKEIKKLNEDLSIEKKANKIHSENYRLAQSKIELLKQELNDERSNTTQGEADASMYLEQLNKLKAELDAMINAKAELEKELEAEKNNKEVREVIRPVDGAEINDAALDHINNGVVAYFYPRPDKARTDEHKQDVQDAMLAQKEFLESINRLKMPNR